jgi:hypothetical protein
MPIQVHDVPVHAMSGTELSRVPTEFRLHFPEPINKSPLESRGRHCYAIKSGRPEKQFLKNDQIKGGQLSTPVAFWLCRYACPINMSESPGEIPFQETTTGLNFLSLKKWRALGK